MSMETELRLPCADLLDSVLFQSFMGNFNSFCLHVVTHVN